MSDEPFHQLPDDVTIPVSEVAQAIVRLDGVVVELRRRRDIPSLAEEVDLAIGQMTRWLWPWLGELDDEGDR